MNRDEYTRVTKILGPFSGYNAVPSGIMEAATTRGKLVHEWCTKLMRGESEFEAPKIVIPYLESFKRWWGDGRNVVAVERRNWDDELKLTGEYDLMVADVDGYTLVDLKTSYKPNKTWPLQLSAYKMMEPEFKVVKLQVVHLSKKGEEPRVLHYEDQIDDFMDCYRVYHRHFKNSKEDYE